MNELSDFNPNRLILARQRRSYTKKLLADYAGLNSKLITLHETGAQDPTPESLGMLFRVLKFPVNFFLGRDIEAPTDENASFRSFSRMTAGKRDAALAAGGIAYLLADWMDQKINLPSADIPDCSGMDPDAAAMVVRTERPLGQVMRR
ncbi:transcriptional regulator [Pseudomonas syringae]|uniref:transcriptional regulator n=1 Tax=Pseudomonas syringae TaxID=317 RepID=UPI0018E5F0A4|nr:transcriptional regulator [Pseudomonas syringae]MBI6711478.1 transcriptional regulator [Pseudomonas syringae]